MITPYDDIINLPHHVSTTRPHMPVPDRAALFSPFAALTGYEAAIKETARPTEERVVLDENSKADLEMKLQILAWEFASHPEVDITYFQDDAIKAGGTYIHAIGTVKKIDEYRKVFLMTDGTKIPIEAIIDIESELFREYL